MARPAPAVFAQIPLFRRVGPEDRERIATVATVRAYEKGERIFDEGDPSDFFQVIVSGRVKVFKKRPDGNDIMSRWGKDDVLRTEKDGFVVVDRAMLQALADG